MPEEEQNNARANIGEKQTENTVSETANISDQEINSIQPGKAHPTDPDFIIMLAIAFFADVVLDLLLDLAGLVTVVLPVINKIIDFFLGVLICAWIYWRSKQFTLPRGMSQKLHGMEKRVASKIQAQIQKKVASRALKRALLRTTGAFVVETIPGVNLFTSWTVTVLSML